MIAFSSISVNTSVESSTDNCGGWPPFMAVIAFVIVSV
jgi:hypothetical protein